MAYEYYTRPEWVKPGEQWTPGQEQPVAKPTAVEPTMNDLYGGLYQKSPEELAIEQAQQQKMAAYPTEMPDQATINQRVLQDFQSQIDAINASYAAKKSDITRQYGITGERRLGQQRSILGGAGMLGQVSGFSQQEQLREANANELKAALAPVEAEQSMRIQSLYGEARQMAQDEYQDKLKAYSEGADAIIAYNQDKLARKQTNVDNIIKQALANGIDLSNPKDIQQLAQQLGVNPQMITAAYKEGKSAQEQAQAEAEQKAAKEELEMMKTLSSIDYQTAQTAKLQYEMANPEVKTTIQEINGRMVMFNSQTGETIKDLGPITSKEGGKAGEAEKVSNFFAQSDLEEVNNLISGDSGIKTSVGPTWLGRRGLEEPLTGKKQNFIAGVEKLVSQLSLDALIKAKAEGATFGQLSDKELQILSASASKIGTWRITDKSGKVKGYNANEVDFRAELERIKKLIEKSISSEVAETNQGYWKSSIGNTYNLPY